MVETIWMYIILAQTIHICVVCTYVLAQHFNCIPMYFPLVNIGKGVSFHKFCKKIIPQWLKLMIGIGLPSTKSFVHYYIDAHFTTSLGNAGALAEKFFSIIRKVFAIWISKFFFICKWQEFLPFPAAVSILIVMVIISSASTIAMMKLVKKAPIERWV